MSGAPPSKVDPAPAAGCSVGGFVTWAGEAWMFATQTRLYRFLNGALALYKIFVVAFAAFIYLGLSPGTAFSATVPSGSVRPFRFPRSFHLDGCAAALSFASISRGHGRDQLD